MNKEFLSTLTHLTLRKAAKECGISYHKLYILSKEYGLTFFKKKPSKEELTSVSHLSLTELAEKYNVSPATVSNWVSEYGIKLNRKKYESSFSSKPNKDELIPLLNLTQKEVAEKYGVTKQAVSLWCKEYGIDFKSGRASKFKKPIPSKEELLNKSITEVAEKYGVSQSLASKWKASYNIKPVYLKPSKERLEELKHLTQVEIAEILGVVQTYVSVLYKQYNIDRDPVINRKKKC